VSGWKKFREVLDWVHHAYWISEFLISLGVGKGLQILMTKSLSIPLEWNLPLWLVMSGLLLWLATWIVRKIPKEIPTSEKAVQAPNSMVGIPALSALLGQDPKITFDARAFFARAYYSPVTAEFEKNIKIIAQQTSPNDREAFYTRFIGVGLAAYQHEVTWFTIYGSQLVAMAEMNSRGLVPRADLKKHYDKAVSGYPKTYANYSFDQWVDYMTSRLLIANYPSQMVELSFNGKDFLKYIAHCGFVAADKPN
jgi:hypothetical protein